MGKFVTMLQTANKTLTQKCEKLENRNEFLEAENKLLVRKINELAQENEILKQKRCKQQDACQRFNNMLLPYGFLFNNIK